MNRSIFNNSHFNFFPITTNLHLHLRNLLKLLPSLKMAKGKINKLHTTYEKKTSELRKE